MMCRIRVGSLQHSKVTVSNNLGCCCEAVLPIFAACGVDESRVVRCLLAAMPPGATIPPHHDTGLWVARTHRVHVAVRSKALQACARARARRQRAAALVVGVGPSPPAPSSC